MIDATHDPGLRCWVDSAEGHSEFPVQNLPFGVFSPPGGAPRDFVEIAREADAGIVSPHYSLVTKAQVEASHRAGLRVIAWTANDEKVWADLVAAGVDGIITDDPAGLIGYLKARGLRQ